MAAMALFKSFYKKNIIKIEIMHFPCYDINKMGIYTMESSEIKVTTNEAPNNTDWKGKYYES